MLHTVCIFLICHDCSVPTIVCLASSCLTGFPQDHQTGGIASRQCVVFVPGICGKLMLTLKNIFDHLRGPFDHSCAPLLVALHGTQSMYPHGLQGTKEAKYTKEAKCTMQQSLAWAPPV